MKQKRLVALLLVLAMLFTFVSVIAACDKDDCATNGHKLTAVGKKDATLEEAGYEAYWKCSVCGKMFSDSEGKNEISKPVEIPKLTPHVCKHVCETCGKCTDNTCTDPVCADKCQGHQTVDPDKGKTKDNPLTPDEAIALMKQAGSGVVVGAAEKQQYYIQGVVNAGSTVDTQYHEWTFTLGTGTDKVSCKATIDNSVTNKPSETNGALDGATVIIHGFLELYSGRYQCSYLPASASPTGNKFTPSLVDITIPVAEVASVTLDHTEEMILLANHVNKYMSVKATVLPANAPQDIVWSVSENSANITVSNGRISWTETEGEATITATAKDTNKSASVKVTVQNVHGSTQADPLTVDEAIALMTEDGKEVFAGYAASSKQGFYLTGKVENSVYNQQNVNSYWTFDLVGTDGTLSCTTTSTFSGVSGANGNLDDYTVVVRNALLKKVSEDYTSYNAIPVSATRPAVTSIKIAESVEVNIPFHVKVNVTEVLPANAQLDSTAQWHSSDETKATIDNDGMVTGVSAGVVEVWVSLGNVESNKCSVTVIQQESTNSIVYDWSDGLSSDDIVDDIYNFEIEFVDMLQYVNAWSDNTQTEITAFSGADCMTVMDAALGKGFAFDSAISFGDGSVTINTMSSVKKVTFKIIPFADATTTQLSVNGVEKTQDKGDTAYDGKTNSAFELTVELTEATNVLNVAFPKVSGNSFAIVGITLEQETKSEKSIIYDWIDGLSSDDIVDDIYNFEIEFIDMLQYVNAWSDNTQTEITAFSGADCMTVMDAALGKGFAFDSAISFGDGSVTINTMSSVKKVTFKIIPFADATTTQLSVNGVEKAQDKGDTVYDGKTNSAFELTVELTEATNVLNVAFPKVDGNSFAIVGITLYY